MADSQYTCPVCGFNGLTKPPYSQYGDPVRTGRHAEPLELGDPSYEICPSCGIHFGYHDVASNAPFESRPGARLAIYRTWRDRWIAEGMQFWSRKWRHPPTGWDPVKQLQSIGYDVDAD